MIGGELPISWVVVAVAAVGCASQHRPAFPPSVFPNGVELGYDDAAIQPAVYQMEPFAVRTRQAPGVELGEVHAPDPGRLQIRIASDDAIAGATTIRAVEGQLFGRRRWRVREGEGKHYLETEIEDGAMTLRLRLGCSSDADGEQRCDSPAIDAWRPRVAIVWLPDRETLAHFQFGAAYRAQSDRGGVTVHVLPIARRLGAGALSIGIALGYTDFGPEQRATISLAAEYDLSTIWRRSISSDPDAVGRNRGIQLGLGAEAGVALELAETDFGHGLAFAFALDPYLELRLVPASFVTVPVRFTVPLTFGDEVTSGLALTTGVAIPW